MNTDARRPRPQSPFRRQAAVLAGLATLAMLHTGCNATRQALSRRSEECEALCQQAEAARNSGQEEQASRLVDAALKRRPRHGDSQAALAEALWCDGRPQAALDQLDQAMAENPGDLRLACQRAEWLLDAGQTKEALQAANIALAQDPNQTTALRVRYRCEQKLGHAESALTTLHRLTMADPNDLDAALELSQIHLTRGAGARAAPVLREILQNPYLTSAQRVEAEWLLGRSYMVAERWSDAATQLNRSIRDREPSAADWHLLAAARKQSGDLAGASSAIRVALELDPTHPQSRELAAELPASPTRTAEGVLPAGFINDSTTSLQTSPLPETNVAGASISPDWAN